MREEDLITSDEYLKFAKDNENLCFIKTDFFRLGNKFNWKGELHPITIKNNAIIGYSDYSVTDSMIDGFNKVFCINKETNRTNAFPLPAGVCNDNNDVPIQKIIGNKKCIIDVYNEDYNKKNLVYMNFSKENFLSERTKVFNKFYTTSYTKTEIPEMSMDGRYRYLRNLKKSKFSLCPRGNGIETFRIFESFYMGTIPIVIYHPTHDYCNELPILFINNWDDINEEFLETKYIEFINTTWNLEKLKISYWKKFINEKINEK